MFSGGQSIKMNKKLIFQQNNAPCHTAKIVKEWFSQHTLEVLEWPVRSPDLSPIEHIWADIDRLLVKEPVANLTDLKSELNRHWYAYPRQKCINLIESMRNRIHLCIKAKGGHFRY